jgi:hypothetical protein
MSPEQDDGPLESIDGHFTDLFRASKKPPVWIVEGVLPAGLTIMVGPPKDAYKSTVSAALAAKVAGLKCTALPLDWKAVMRGPVMIFSYEADAGELRSMVEDGMGVKGQPIESIMVADEPDTFRLDDEDAAEQMIFWLDARKPALVILDPLANFHGFEEKDSAKMIHILSPLRRWAKANNSCFLVVHHTRKLQEDRAYRADDARGTSAIFGLCDAILVITPGKKKYELMIDAKFKRSPAWLKTIQLAVWERKGEQGGEALREVDKMILKAIAHGFREPSKIAKHINLGPASVEVRLAFLKTNGYLRVDAKGGYRALEKDQ